MRAGPRGAGAETLRRSVNCRAALGPLAIADFALPVRWKRGIQ